MSGSNSSGGKSTNFDIPILYHHPPHHFPPHRNSGIMNSPIGKAYVAFISNILFISSFFPAAESFPPYHHFHHHQPAASSHNYQNFLNNQMHQQSPHYHQYNSNGNQGNNGNLSRSNSSHMIQSHQQKKSWNSWKSKNHHHHHNNAQKSRTNSGDHHSNSSCSSSSSSSSAASNSRNNSSKGNQNLRTLTYVSTDFVNSRSPTPSPNSLSPIYHGGKRLPHQQSTASSSSSLHQLETLTENQPQSSGFPGEGVPPNALGYESDSSHSSYNPNKQVACETVDYVNSGSVSGFSQVASEITSLFNFPTYSDEDIPGSQSHYGSQQNLSYCNSQQQQHVMQNPYSQFAMGGSNSPTLYSNASCGTSEGGANDHSLAKRG